MTQSTTQAEAGQGRETTNETPKGGSDNSLNDPGKEQQSYQERFAAATTPADIARLTQDLAEGRLTLEDKTATASKDSGGENADGGAGGTDDKSKPAEGDAGSAENADAAATNGGGEDGGDAAAKTAGSEEGKDAGKQDDKAKGEGEHSEEQLPERIRLTNFSKVEKLALQLKREDPKLSLAEAETRAKAALGIKDEAPAKVDEAADKLPKSIAEVEAKLKELIDQRTKAFEDDLDFKAANRLTLEIEALKDHKLTLKERAVSEAKAARTAYDQAFDEAQAKAESLYDFVKQGDSEAFKRMAEIDGQLAENKDPLYNDPAKPLIIAQMVAKELAIAPKTPGKNVAKTSTATGKPLPAATTPPAGGKKSVPPVASGTSRTSTSNTQGAAIAAKIDGLKTAEDLEKFIASFGG